MNNINKNKQFLTIFIALMILVISALQITDIFFVSDSTSETIIRNVSFNIILGTFLTFVVYYIGYSLFKKPNKKTITLLAIIIPGMLIAINNFPFSAFISGRTLILEENHVIYLFAIECLSIGFLEEVAFRGIILIILIERLPKNKKGYLIAIIISSTLFGVAHLVNIIGGSSFQTTLLQVIYSSLMGALWSIVFIMTSNLLFPIFLHASFNFLGLVLFKVGTVSNRYDSFTIITTFVLAAIAFLYYVFIFKHLKDKDINRIILSDHSS